MINSWEKLEDKNRRAPIKIVEWVRSPTSSKCPAAGPGMFPWLNEQKLGMKDHIRLGLECPGLNLPGSIELFAEPKFLGLHDENLGFECCVPNLRLSHLL